MRSTRTARSRALAVIAMTAGLALTIPTTPALATTIEPAAAPKVSKVSPGNALVGQTKKVTITGSAFKKVVSISFVKSSKAYQAKSFKVVSSKKISATAPALSAGTYQVKVTTTSGSRSGGKYTVRTYAGEVVRLVNSARGSKRKCGSTTYKAAKKLAVNSKLTKAAQGHATDMAEQDYFSHTSKDGRSFVDRINATGYKWSGVGENIAAGYQTPSAVMKGLLKSSGHCKNIMNPRFRNIGVGFAKGGSYGTYWVQDFGSPR